MWSLVRPPCSVEVPASGGMCAPLRGSSVPFSATCMNALVISYRVIGSHFHPFVRLCECEREKRSRAISRPSSLFPWMAPAGGNCPSLSSYLAEVLFTPPHVKFINISLSFFFFRLSFCPSECLQIRFSCQAVSCWGLNDRRRCIAHQKEQ